MRAGFTGTQASITGFQWSSLYWLLAYHRPEQCHHGDCIGGDLAFHQASKSLGLYVVLHPPTDPKKRAFCLDADEIRLEKPYLERNHDVVDETDYLIATPKSAFEETRSGTWSTVRYARKLLRPIYIILPNGQYKTENL